MNAMVLRGNRPTPKKRALRLLSATRSMALKETGKNTLDKKKKEVLEISYNTRGGSTRPCTFPNCHNRSTHSEVKKKKRSASH